MPGSVYTHFSGSFDCSSPNQGVGTRLVLPCFRKVSMRTDPVWFMHPDQGRFAAPFGPSAPPRSMPPVTAETPDQITNRYACKKMLIKLFLLLLLSCCCSFIVCCFLLFFPSPPPFHHSRHTLTFFTTIDPNHILLSPCQDLSHHSQPSSQTIELFQNKYLVCIMADHSHYSSRPRVHPYHDSKGIIEARTIWPGMKIVSNASNGSLYGDPDN